MHSINPAGYVIHSAIHKARPDVIAAVHCHSVPSKAFSSLGIKLDPITQDACRYESYSVWSGKQLTRSASTMTMVYASIMVASLSKRMKAQRLQRRWDHTKQ